MPWSRPLPLLCLLALLAACADDPTASPRPGPGTPNVLGVFEFTLRGIGTPDASASMAPAQPPVPGGPSLTLTPRSAGIVLETVSSGSFTEGTRGQGGHRYISVTFRVRNATGTALGNLTFIPSITTATLAGTPFSSVLQFNGTPAAASLASQVVPTGAVTLGAENTLRATDVDVLQVFQESEVAAVPLPAGVTGLMPYGFVVRNPRSAFTRALPPAESADDFGGLVTLAFRYPLTAGASTDPFQISFQALAVEDTETRVTESIEEGQDTSAVRRLRERAASLGATTVTILAGSSATAPEVPDYPFQRQVCTVRTAGTAASPVTHITAPAAYTRINLLRQGEVPSACGAYFRDGSAPPPAAGVPHTLTLVAVDRYGNVRPVADSVRLSYVAGPLVTVPGPAALANGQGSLQATFNANGTAVVRLTGRRVATEHAVVVGAPTVVAGTAASQAGMAGTAVSARPTVLLRDALGNPLPGRTVTFSVTGGGGSLTGATAVTDAGGYARVGSWTLGATADLNTLAATVDGAGVTGNPVTFAAAGCAPGAAAGYGITLCYTSPMTDARRTAFQAGVARWQGLVTGDLPAIAVAQPGGFCGAGSPALAMTVDDLLIFAGVEPIDGVGAVLGSAGPCWIRTTGSLSIVGRMRFDEADVATMEAEGRFGAVIVHEMGHVLGIGTLWPNLGLLQSPSSAGSPLDTYFSGAAALAGFNAIGGATYTGGQKVPVENTGRVGNMNAHWRESVLDNELMTGWIDTGSTPLSELSVRSLADMGYTVDAAGADPFFITLTLRQGDAADEPGLLLMDDVWTLPLHRVDARGRATRIR